MNWIIRIRELIIGDQHTFAIRHARRLRQMADSNIDGMVADLNGCSDKWFLETKDPLDECIPAENGKE